VKDNVKRQPSPTDRRGSNVILTEKGQALLSDIFPPSAKQIHEVDPFQIPLYGMGRIPSRSENFFYGQNSETTMKITALLL
jgi:hypothetical protein